MTTTYKWQFSARFRRHAFGWKSQPAILRIKEAVSEIRQVARKEPVLAADGAILFLEKLSPAIEHVDSTSGAIGTAVNRAIEALVAVIANAQLEQETRQRWLERLWRAEESNGLEAPVQDIARTCEAILLSSGFADEAYKRYAMDANQGTTHLATFRAIAKKYPGKPAETILHDLVAHHPGQEGKWFAAAKDAGLFDLAIELVNQSPADPRTLARAARDYATEQPHFAIAAGMAALRHIAQGHGYEITGPDVLDAYSALMEASTAAKRQDAMTHGEIRALLSACPENNFVYMVLARHLQS